MYAHWGTFTKPYNVNTCLGFANTSMNRRGYTVWETASDGDYMLIGGNNDVIVNITCVPQNDSTWISVSAYSTDSATAEAARNNVRTDIVNLVLID